MSVNVTSSNGRLANSAAVAGLGIVALGYYYYNRNKVPAKTEQDVDEILRLGNDTEVDLNAQDPPIRHHTNRKRWRRVTLVVKVVNELKIRFQVIRNPQPVDYVAVQRYAYDVMQNDMKDISRADMVRVAPLAAAMYWAKMDSEIEAEQMMQSHGMHNTNELHNRSYIGNWRRRFSSWLAPAPEH